MKNVVIANVIIQSLYAVCVTVVACVLGMPRVLAWYALMPFMFVSYKTAMGFDTEKREGAEDEQNGG